MLNFRSVFVLASILFLSACGAGGGSTGTSSSSTSSGATTTYTSSAAAGEVLNFTINNSVTPPTYSYTIVKSAYGLTGQTGSGTLSSNSDGSFTPSGSPDSRVYSLPNGLLVGGIKLNLQGTVTTVPILGVSTPITVSSALAGTYNYVSSACNAAANGLPTFPNCQTDYGTVKINANGTFTACSQGNITTSVNCSTSSGTFANPSNGVWEYIRTGSVNKNYLIAFTAPNGQNVLLLDFNDPTGYGFGQGVASSQPTTNSIGGIDGTYIYNSNNGVSGSVTVSGTNFTDRYPGGSVNGTISTGLWNGLVSAATVGNTDNGVAIIAGTGVYVYRNNRANQNYYSVGILKN